MKSTTVREVHKLAADIARDEEITEAEALEKISDEYELICFMGMWDNPDAEVLVPDTMPVAGQQMHGIIIY